MQHTFSTERCATLSLNGAEVLREDPYSVLAAQLANTRNNHTETVLIKLLLGPLALASYWLTLTS